MTEYATLAEAISAASSLEGSTVTLLDNVSLSSMITVTSGKFTIDLNGKTWKCSDNALLLRGAVDVKITDNSTSGSGKIATTSYSDTIYMWGFGGTTKLEIAGGTIESNGDSVVYTGYNDATTDTYLTVSGGKLTTTGYVAISAYGENVTITGGELESTRENIYHLTGLIDLSGHSDPTGIIIYADRNTDVDVVNDYNVLLPDGYVLLDSSGNEATAYEYGVRYTVGKANEDDWGNDDTVTEKKASVQKSDGTERFFSSLAEAISAASSFEDSTVTLLDDVNAKIAIESGKFTIDLNGKTWQSEFNTLTTKGTSDIKVIDSSSGSGKIVTTGLGGSAIAMYDSSKLEIAGGTVGGAGDDVVDGYGYGAVTMSDNGYATLAELTVSGGKLISQDTDTIYAKGNKVTVTGGELVCDSGYYNLFYMTGTIDLSGHPDPSGITIISVPDTHLSNIIIPDGYELFYLSSDGASDGEYMVVKKNVTQIEIDLGARADETNVRYAEIGGVVTAIEENDDKYIVEIGENNLLVEVVEKTAEGEFVKAQYFYVYMTAKIAIKLDMDSYMTTDGNTSIRTSNPMGMRFKSSVLTSAKSEKSEYVIDEYGFIVATEDALGETELTLDFSKYVTGVAYNKESGTDIVFDASVDEVHVFSGYVKNIPAAQYKTNLVCKTYTKLTVGGESFVVYGEAVTGNIYDTANTLLADETLDAETKEALTQIVLDYENTLGLPGDGLYPEE